MFVADPQSFDSASNCESSSIDRINGRIGPNAQARLRRDGREHGGDHLNAVAERGFVEQRGYFAFAQQLLAERARAGAGGVDFRLVHADFERLRLARIRVVRRGSGDQFRIAAQCARGVLGQERIFVVELFELAGRAGHRRGRREPFRQGAGVGKVVHVALRERGQLIIKCG